MRWTELDSECVLRNLNRLLTYALVMSFSIFLLSLAVRRQRDER